MSLGATQQRSVTVTLPSRQMLRSCLRAAVRMRLRNERRQRCNLNGGGGRDTDGTICIAEKHLAH